MSWICLTVFSVSETGPINRSRELRSEIRATTDVTAAQGFMPILKNKHRVRTPNQVIFIGAIRFITHFTFT